MVFDTVSALHFYNGPYRRLSRMRLSMWPSILFLHCIFTMDPKTASDEALDVVLDTVSALLLYYGPYRRLSRMRLSMCSCTASLLRTLSKTTSDEAFDVVFDTVSALLLYYGRYRRLPRMRLSMWSSILFLHCFLNIHPIEEYLG